MTDVSIVIPTYNRLEVLPEVLGGLDRQRDAPTFEILVVDDGSSDGTAEWLAAQVASRPASAPRLTVIGQANRGPARARNRGVAAATGRRVAFLGDDTVPAPGWLAAHARSAAARPGEPLLAIVGYTGWHSRMRLNPFLRYINEHGLQFGYALIDEPDDVPFNFLYTSNLTLPRQALLDEPFDEGFPYAAWEDTELAYRLKARGLRLVYEARARVAHDHPTDIARFASRQEKAGYSAVVFYSRHPELGGFLGLGSDGPGPMPPKWLHRGRSLLARALQNLPISMTTIWQELFRHHYLIGLHRGWRDRHLLAGGKP